MKHYNYSSEASPEEHKAEFEKLGTLSDDAMETIMNPAGVDEAKWEKAKKISMETYGELRYPFIMYLTKHKL